MEMQKKSKVELKEQLRLRKLDREIDREEKRQAKEKRLNLQREKAVLKFMSKTGVLFHHHGLSDSLKEEIEKRLKRIQENGNYQEYNQYKGLLPLSQLGCLFSSKEFQSVYDVPLDGTYKFEVYDSGERGLGSFRRMTVIKVEEKFQAPYVNPGAIIPITAN